MDTAGQWRKCTILLLHFLTVSSYEASSGNVSGERQSADITSEQHALPSRYSTSVDAEPEHGGAGVRAQSRWHTQMVFSKSVYSFEVTEDTVPGTVVGKVEIMFESLTPITYSVQEDDGGNLFLLSPFSGEFLLSRSLDFEAQRFFILTAEVRQGDSHVSSVRVYFNVLDVNDNPPVFSQGSFSVTLREDARVGTCLLYLNVSDEDDGDNGHLNLRVVAGDEEQVFLINPTGSLCLRKELDRERQSVYNLTVTANDCARPLPSQFTSTAQVNVAVEDVNDNAPLFASAQSLSIPEDTALHSVVMTVHAKDADFGSNGEILYHLNTSGGVFSIDSRSGRIYLEEALDREQVDRLTVGVTAADRGSPRMSSTMNLTVTVGDANDHDPEFSQSAYILTVREDAPRGTRLGQVQAHDQDIGKNGQVRYALTQTGPFVVDMVRGVITVMEALDREKVSNYTLAITAADQGAASRSATAALSITVLDVNDFAPAFYPDTLVIHVMENDADPSQLTRQVSAVDEDVGVNSQLTYFIEEGPRGGLFSITPSGMFRVLHHLDREKEPTHTVTIIAVDSGTLTIHVIVEDINDNYPVFTEEVYNTLVSEDSPAGTVFAMITASDVDEGASGEIRYFMENLDAPFSIGETSGELFTTDILDRETVAFYILKVISSDKHPTQPLSSSALVTVVIGDVNDHWPQFLNSPYVAYVPTEMAPGSVVCAVRATDEDAEINAILRYSLYGQLSDQFSIDPFSGAVFASSALRRREDVTVNVYVEDAGENPKFDISTISVRFQNVSDFPEMDVDVLRSSLSEDEQVGTPVAVVSARSVRSEPVSFYLAAGNFEDMFHVEPLNGAVTVENPLDYENKTEFTLLIEARDSGSPPFSSFAEIHINISDANDNSPRFTQDDYRCEVFENSPPSWVCDVFAADADSDIFGAVQYNITEGNTNGAFTIDLGNGVLSTTRSLDREHLSEYNLTVEAMEVDNPLHKDRATVIVAVLDRNDNAPRFSQIFLTEIPEDSPVGHTVMQVASDDDDIGANAVINYSIIDPNDVMPFNIDFTAGYITVGRQLDREMQDHYILRVNANDSAWSISTDVTIVITDVNDNRPLFSDRFYTAAVPETKDEDVLVMRVVATDADLEQNSEILYAIEPPNEEFWVNASSGSVYTKQPLMLHDSAFEIYEFTVIAFDRGLEPLCSNTTVSVRLEPHNYYPPVFLPSRPLTPIPYDMPVNTEVVHITAVDPDVNMSSADIQFALSGGNASDFFWIQGNNGKVMLNRSLAQGVDLLLTLIVMAKDGGTPPLSSQTELTFEVTGRNQFSPSFREPNVTFFVPEDLPAGSVVRKIQAEDGDDGCNGAVTYSITPGNQYLPFSVGEVSGLLTLTRKLDFEKESIYHLRITATDGGWVSKTGVLNVTVVVIDVNDNPPVFSAPEYVTSVPENSAAGTDVLSVKATDADSGANAQITYSLSAGHVDKFVIDSRNGTITTLVTFDYEQEHTFYVTVKALNPASHPLFSLAHVVVQISDVNEFTPKFVTKELNLSVFKNVPIGTRIGKATATDDDQGSEGQVFYVVFGQGKHKGFEIDRLSGDIYTTASLRKQGNTHVVLKVLAKNSGVITGMDIDEASVQIAVMDTNDPPSFTSVLHVANVTEDSPVGTSVITVSAQDQDSALDGNHFFFDIVDGNTNSSFDIDPSSGVITVKSPLDREQWPSYNLTVTATDNGAPPATGTANIIVIIDDVNDNAPRLTFTEAQVKENQPQGTIVARLNATDSDFPPNHGPFTYGLLNASSSGHAFSLTTDGILSTTMPIDREQTSAHRVLVAVRDAGIPPLSSTTTFHIRILDENDNPSVPRNVFIEVKYYGISFEGGMIGNVHPEDPDESDTFSCGIKSGPPNMFMIPNGTCELWSSPFQGEATFNITIEATDQLHFPVNNSIYINYKGFTNATMDSCVLFYVSCASMEEFLSHRYLRFVKALDSLFNLQASKTHVFGIKHIGNEILLLAAVKNYNGQYLSREVASGISAGHKKLLESQSNVTISRITSDPCLTGPCQNGAACNKKIYISQDVAVLESTAVIFVSPRKEILNCTCPAGFTGPLCEGDIDECEMSPCENQTTCVNAPGGFYCQCQSGFSGSVCSSDVGECLNFKCHNGGTCIPTQEGYHCHCVSGFEGETCEQSTDHCRSAPCAHGTCINSLRGFSCQCPFGVSGVFCEESSYSFDELSFMEFPPLDRRTNLISLEFATVQNNSLLLYNPGGLSSREFFALEIINGSVCLSYDLGSGPVRLWTSKPVADGYFHSAAARRIGNMGSLHVDNCTDVESNGFCFSQSDGSSSERTLDVSNNMTFGGLRTVESILLRPAQIKTHAFVGCIRNVHVNGIRLRPPMALAAYNIFEGCPRAKASPCHINPCKNGGECQDGWFDYLCVCKRSFTGRNCEKEMSEELVLRFNGSDYVEYVIKEQFKRDYQLKDVLEGEIHGNVKDHTAIDVKFKTKDDGVIVFVLGQTGHTILEIKDRRPVYISKDTRSGSLSEFIVDTLVSDGIWHVLCVSSNGHNTFLLLDGKLVLNITDRSVDLTPVNVDKIVLGSAPAELSKLRLPGFTGCVQYFNVTGYTLPVSGHSEMVDVRPSATLIHSRCRTPDHCFPSPCTGEEAAARGCLSDHCQSRRSCRPATQNGSCICLHNTTAHACDVCVAATGSSDRCSEMRGGPPMWVLAVILPALSILGIITGLCFTLHRLRRLKPKCQVNSSPQKTRQGTDNIAYCFDDSRVLKDAASAGEGEQRAPMSADEQAPSAGFYRDASLASGRPVSKSELECYEIDSVCSAFRTDSLGLSWREQLNGAACVRADSKQWGDLQVLFAGFKTGCSSEDSKRSPAGPQHVASVNKQPITGKETARSPKTQPCYTEWLHQPELLAPPQRLTFEEIRRLNSPLEQSAQTPATSEPTKLRADSDTDGRFVHSEFECGQFPAVRKFKPEEVASSECSFRQQSLLAGSSLVKHACLSAAGHPQAEPSPAFEQRGSILNMNLPFGVYAPVFEDIARLPIQPSHTYDMQSDVEEII